MAEQNPLLFTKKNGFDTVSQEEQSAIAAYAEDYKAYLDASKTEREAVSEAIRQAERVGFKPLYAWSQNGKTPETGDLVYKSLGGKALFLAVIGKKPISDGLLIAGAHVDSPRLDLKQQPLYEDKEMALFKTHYYGGIKKYHWVATPLALHGVVVKTDGETVNIVIGEKDDEPTFIITDLLPHLGKDQNTKTLGSAFTGESLNILVGSKPYGQETDSSRFKLQVLSILSEKYGIKEEDFLSAELEAVPAGKARDLGFDRSMIAGYGHDDRSCAYAILRAIFDEGENTVIGKAPDRTLVGILSDKEEIGSMGVTGAQSHAFETFVAQLGGDLDTANKAFENSFCLSADVCNAYDPNYPEVSEPNNAARINYGVGILKHTGSGGKSGSSEASAEVVAFVRKIFAEAGVIWQMGELGKVDQGGGGTIAQFMANRNIPTIDAGVPVLSMHAPWETVSKLDCYMTYKAVLAVYES